MDGHIAPLDEICALAKQHSALVFIDECHATGFLGPTGRGTDEYRGVKVDIINSTLGKAMGGGTGGSTKLSGVCMGGCRNVAKVERYLACASKSVLRTLTVNLSKVFPFSGPGSFWWHEWKPSSKTAKTKDF